MLLRREKIRISSARLTAVRVLCAVMMSVSKKKDAFESFSEKQLRVLSWWCPSSPDRNFDAIICDGAVRSGKTVCMSVSFVAWAFSAFDDTSFALCGKTVTSLRRNIITPILPVLRRLGFDCREKLSSASGGDRILRQAQPIYFILGSMGRGLGGAHSGHDTRRRSARRGCPDAALALSNRHWRGARSTARNCGSTATPTRRCTGSTRNG